MIPSTNIVNTEESNNINTSKTYLINFNKESLQGKIDELEAVKQAAYMILSTEKGAYTMYPLDYGTSLEKYIGKSYDYVTGDIDREIKEYLKIKAIKENTTVSAIITKIVVEMMSNDKGAK